jgi:cysteine synthase
MAHARGLKALFTVPPSTSEEKVLLLKSMGAEVEICASVGMRLQ